MKNALNKGFTLLEVLVALGILVIAITGLLYAFINCILLNESNGNLVKAANDAQYVLEQIKGEDYSDIDDFVTNFNTSQFSNLNNEQVAFSEANIGTDIADITLNVTWTERGRNRDFGLSTRLAP
jgi:prepilin-type N-terminal cleavage/methylation domain-containing protein